MPLPVALIVEGAPPALSAGAIGGFLYPGLAGTVVAYVVWFRGLRQLPLWAASLVGLLNPVSGTILGVALAGESFGGSQALGLLLVLAGILAGQPAVTDRLRRRRTATVETSRPANRARLAPPDAARPEAATARTMFDFSLVSESTTRNRFTPGLLVCTGIWKALAADRTGRSEATHWGRPGTAGRPGSRPRPPGRRRSAGTAPSARPRPPTRTA